jgi:hypothetical protein
MEEQIADEVREDLKTAAGRLRIEDDLFSTDVVGMLLAALAEGTTAALLSLEDDLIEAAVHARANR